LSASLAAPWTSLCVFFFDFHAGCPPICSVPPLTAGTTCFGEDRRVLALMELSTLPFVSPFYSPPNPPLLCSFYRTGKYACFYAIRDFLTLRPSCNTPPFRPLAMCSPCDAPVKRIVHFFFRPLQCSQVPSTVLPLSHVFIPQRLCFFSMLRPSPGPFPFLTSPPHLGHCCGPPQRGPEAFFFSPASHWAEKAPNSSLSATFLLPSPPPPFPRFALTEPVAGKQDHSVTLRPQRPLFSSISFPWDFFFCSGDGYTSISCPQALVVPPTLEPTPPIFLNPHWLFMLLRFISIDPVPSPSQGEIFF